MSEATTDTVRVVSLVEGPENPVTSWPIYATAKAVGVENRGSQNIEIQLPGSYNRVTVKVNDKEKFHVEGRYTGRYPNAFSNLFPISTALIPEMLQDKLRCIFFYI